MPTWCRPSTQSTPGDFFDVTHGIFVKRCTCCSFVIHIALKPYSCISESFISRPLSRDTASRVHMCWKWHEHHFSNFHVSCVFNVQLSDLNTLTFSKKNTSVSFGKCHFLLIVPSAMDLTPPSLQDLLLPLMEVHQRLTLMQDLERQLQTMSADMAFTQPEVAMLLNQSRDLVKQASNRFKDEQAMLFVIFRRTLQEYVRHWGRLPSVRHDGWD